MRRIALALIAVPLTQFACAQAEDVAPVETKSVPPALSAAPATSAVDPALDAAVAEILGEDAASTRTVVRVVGDGEGRIAVVYLVGMTWCGSGGCNLLILRPRESRWEPVGNIARVSPPIRLLTTSSQGLPDIGVTVSGGGGPPAYEARMAFDGQSYPRFPTDEPLVGAAGSPVITDADVAAGPA